MKSFIVGLLILISFFIQIHAQDTRPRIVVSTHIGGTDPDDNQRMIHLMMYLDLFVIERLISSPFAKAEKRGGSNKKIACQCLSLQCIQPSQPLDD